MPGSPTYAELEAQLDHIRQSPKDTGIVDLIALRPALGKREVLEEAELTLTEGVSGDTWKDRPSRHTGDGSPHPEMQLNLMNSRMVVALAPDDDGRALARSLGQPLLAVLQEVVAHREGPVEHLTEQLLPAEDLRQGDVLLGEDGQRTLGSVRS